MQMMHLIVDGLAANLYLLRQEADLCAYLRHLVDLLGMRLMTEPLSVKAVGFGPESGVTAMAIISESHIVLHSWPERNDFNLNVDVFSCRCFRDGLVMEDLREHFQMNEWKRKIIWRPLLGETKAVAHREAA